MNLNFMKAARSGNIRTSATSPFIWETQLSKSGETFGVSLILMIAAAMRIGYLLHDPVLDRDAIYYLQICRDWNNVVNGDSRYSPIFLWLLHILYQLKVAPETWGRGLNICLGVGCVLWSYLCSRKLLISPVPALGIALLAATQPAWVVSSCSLLKEPIGLFFFGASFYFFLIYIQNAGKAFIVLSGLCCSIAILCRYEMITLAGGVAGYFLLKMCQNKASWKQVTGEFLLFVLSIMAGVLLLFVLMGLPWLHYFYGIRWRFRW